MPKLLLTLLLYGFGASTKTPLVASGFAVGLMGAAFIGAISLAMTGCANTSSGTPAGDLDSPGDTLDDGFDDPEGIGETDIDLGDTEPRDGPLFPGWERPVGATTPDWTGWTTRAGLPETITPWPFVSHVERRPGEAPKPATQGYFALGNGTVFGFTGTHVPLNVIHAAIGPGYQKTKRYFPDVAISAALSGDPVTWTSEGGGRFRRLPVFLTRSHAAGGVVLDTLAFAPLRAERMFQPLLAPGAAEHGMIMWARFSVAEGGSLSRFRPTVVVGRDLTPVAGKPCLDDDTGDQRMRICIVGAASGAEWTVGTVPGGREKALLGPEGTLSGSDVVEFALVLAFTTERDLGAAEVVFSATQREIGTTPTDWKAMLAHTAAAWTQWHAPATPFETPEQPRIGEFVDGMLLTIGLQTTRTGALCPMSYYTSTWMRDTEGAIRLLAKRGMTAHIRRLLDYQFVAASTRGGIGNSMTADIPFPAFGPPPEVDWAAKAQSFSGRLAAEGPTHIPLSYLHYVRAGGDAAVIAERWAFIRHAMDGQKPVADPAGALPFSGDETYRPALGINVGLGAEFRFEDEAWSAGSGFLYAMGYEALAEMGERAGRPAAEIAELRATATQARERTEALYRLDAYYRPYILRHGDRFTLNDRTHPAPCAEDINTLPLWLGYVPPTDAFATANVAHCVATVGRPDGLWGHPPPEAVELLGFNIGNGLMTGMAPGLVLYSLAAVNHPQMKVLFNTIGRIMDDGGQFSEDHLHDTYEALSPFYARNGSLGEQWARFRFWEGAMVAEAVMAAWPQAKATVAGR